MLGFSLLELVVSMALTAVVTGCVLLAAAGAQDAFASQPESADLQQRLRVAVTMLMKDLMAAGAGRTADDPCGDGLGAPVMPYRIGAIANVGAAGQYYRPGVISVSYAESAGSGALTGTVRRTYYLERAGPDSTRLMLYDGLQTDHPVLEDVIRLEFEFFGIPAGAAPTAAPDLMSPDPSTFGDGPWCPHPDHPEKFDEDLLRIRRIRVHLRLQAPRAFRGPAGSQFLFAGNGRPLARVPDQAIRFDVALRNLDGRR